MTEHRVVVFVRSAGRRVARCSCGWVGQLKSGYDDAEIEGRAHLAEHDTTRHETTQHAPGCACPLPQTDAEEVELARACWASQDAEPSTTPDFSRGSLTQTTLWLARRTGRVVS